MAKAKSKPAARKPAGRKTMARPIARPKHKAVKK